ncbi:hypothetical protein FKR81_37380 [Lentzea tibetensis]|uniref:Uncharacterized protein n=1 Tax=Lentzea tibetensis TaxID=2591470 RepID=A0A563EHE2_9PSEU|nr:hypothetical protein [Lentzea tibetensis]TWP46047.1 hypothetical protein FKR81_37380 [Lentzea tibetensis]
MTTTTTAPFEMIENGVTVMCCPVTFDGRKVTVHAPDGSRTRTRRNCGGYATAAVLRAMGYADLRASISGDGDDERVAHFTVAAG